jgi:hypothetical protein
MNESVNIDQRREQFNLLCARDAAMHLRRLPSSKAKFYKAVLDVNDD